MTEKPIRVLQIDSSMIWGGGQSQISTLIRESKNLPLEHHLACPKNSKLYFKVRSNVAGYVPLGRLGILSPLSMIRIRNYCRTHKIQILHSHCGKSHTFAYWLKRFFLPKIILVAHRRIPAKIRSNLVSRKKFIDGAVDHFISVSNYIKGVLMSGGVEESRITTIRSSKKPFESNNEHKILARAALKRTRDLAPNGEFFVLSASRLVPDKGLFILIEAFRRLVRELPTARLLIAGEGPLESELKVAAKALTESGLVTFLGFRKDVPDLLMGADVFAIPSLSEGLGSTIVEAMLARTPVVGSAVEGIPELIQNGTTGILVQPGDAEGLFNALLKLAYDKNLKSQLAEKAYDWATHSCGPAIMVEKTFRIYQSLIKNPDCR